MSKLSNNPEAMVDLRALLYKWYDKYNRELGDITFVVDDLAIKLTTRNKNNMRYILHPGHVLSKNDDDLHFINAHQLAKLYGVDIRECVFGDMPGYREQEGDIHLRPQYDGNYTLPFTDASNKGNSCH